MTTYVSGGLPWPANGTAPTTQQLRDFYTALRDGLVAIGLVQTSDTGQLDINTVTWPGTSQDIGYMVFRFDDAAQATDPVFLKITVGRGPNAGVRRTTFLFGQGSNGSGTITGQTSTQVVANMSSTTAAAATLSFYMAFSSGVLFYGEGYGVDTAARIFTAVFCAERTRDANGNLDGVGLVIHSQIPIENRVKSESVRWIDNAYKTGLHLEFCLVPNANSSSADVAGNLRYFPMVYPIPEVRMAFGIVAVNTNEFPATPTTFVMDDIYGDPRTFICFGSDSGSGAMICTVISSGDYTPAFLWE